MRSVLAVRCVASPVTPVVARQMTVSVTGGMSRSVPSAPQEHWSGIRGPTPLGGSGFPLEEPVDTFAAVNHVRVPLNREFA